MHAVSHLLPTIHTFLNYCHKLIDLLMNFYLYDFKDQREIDFSFAGKHEVAEISKMALTLYTWSHLLLVILFVNIITQLCR
jgi:hypothetical protein